MGAAYLLLIFAGYAGRMNPFTRFLSQWGRDGRLDTFVSYWDRLEFIMVQVHREKMSPQAAEAEFAEVWGWLRANYERWADQFYPFWVQTVSGGEVTAVDPFQLLIDIPTPYAILGDWRAMQHLPSAREALNQYILAQSAG